jgi:thiamine biosynthesis lipoprotein
MARHEREFRAMGSDCRVVVVHDDARDPEVLLDGARDEVERLEQAWSRFRPTSELSALDARGGLTTVVSSDTFEILELALAAWAATEGRFDPTVRDALEGAGYSRSFDELSRVPGPVGPRTSTIAPSSGCGAIRLDQGHRSVTLPPGLRIDLGGLGKGRAADLVAGWLLAAGAEGVCVDLGGDVRVAGRPPLGPTWPIAVDEPFRPGSQLAVLDLVDGAVATSSCLRRRWATTAGGDAHHLIDPATGLPSTSDLATVTVVAGEAVWADVYAKAALIAGSADGVALLAEADLSALLVTSDGDLLTAGPIDRFLRPSTS